MSERERPPTRLPPPSGIRSHTGRPGVQHPRCGPVDLGASFPRPFTHASHHAAAGRCVSSWRATSSGAHPPRWSRALQVLSSSSTIKNHLFPGLKFCRLPPTLANTTIHEYASTARRPNSASLPRKDTLWPFATNIATDRIGLRTSTTSNVTGAVPAIFGTCSLRTQCPYDVRACPLAVRRVTAHIHQNHCSCSDLPLVLRSPV